MREAIRDWKMKRPPQVESLKADIDKGLVDLAVGRVKDFNAAEVIERGRNLLAAPTYRMRRQRG